MKSILTVSVVVFCGLVGISLAGSPGTASPAGCHGRPAASSCHGPEMALVAQDPGCHGRTMQAPAVADAGCHGGRLTLAERRTSRSAARANYRTTLAQFREAGRSGNVSAVSVNAAPTMQYVPVADACQCGNADCPGCR